MQDPTTTAFTSRTLRVPKKWVGAGLHGKIQRTNCYAELDKVLICESSGGAARCKETKKHKKEEITSTNCGSRTDCAQTCFKDAACFNAFASTDAGKKFLAAEVYATLNLFCVQKHTKSGTRKKATSDPGGRVKCYYHSTGGKTSRCKDYCMYHFACTDNFCEPWEEYKLES